MTFGKVLLQILCEQATALGCRKSGLITSAGEAVTEIMLLSFILIVKNGGVGR